ncbi:MAG: hypothetical protein LQ346_001308 [Caloplaca aetnensis]|nr:MAG: hypothetical protein LQ346_001308 [Caloplaca aetnensis]
MADGDVIITICMLADTESSISSENQSRGSDSSRDTLVIGNPSGEPSILFAAGRAVKGQSAEPRITTSGGWKSEDSESMSSQHTLKGATPSGERSVPCKTVPRTQGDNGTDVDKQSRPTEAMDREMRFRKAQGQIVDRMAQLKLEQVTEAPTAADLRNTEDLENETRKALGGDVDSLPFLVSPESRKRRRVKMTSTAASFVRVGGLDLRQTYRWLIGQA